MKPARIVRARGFAWGAFASGFDLELPESGLVLLRGENLDTKGGSASGKSTLIHALNYGHGTCPVPLTALQSWYTQDSPKLDETYDIDGKVVEISRGKKFELTIDGEPFRGSAAQKEEKIDQLFGADAEMRRALTYRAQGSRGLFLSKTDSKKKEFLTKLLDLEKWEEENRKALAKIGALEDKVLMATARLADARARFDTLLELGDGAEIEQELAEIGNEIDGHEALQQKYLKNVADMRADAEVVASGTLELCQPEIDALTENVQTLERFVIEKPAMSDALVKLKQLQSDGEQRVKRLEQEDRDRQLDLLKQAQALRNDWQALALKASGSHRLLADRDRIAAEVLALQKNVCPTCQREWDEVTQKLEELKDELQQITGELEDLRDVQEQAIAVKEEYDALPKTVEANPLIAKMGLALAKIVHDIAAEEARILETCRVQLDEHSRALRAARAALKDATDRAYTASRDMRAKALAGIQGLEFLALQEKATKVKLEQRQAQLNQLAGAARERNRQMAELEKTVAALEAELGPARDALAAEKDFHHLSGREGFRGSVFDEALDAISAETNEMLASISNTRNTTLEFVSESLTQDGKLRYEIVPVITINGHKTDLTYGPSGGMRSAIELAVDLAVGKVISERTGVCPGWLILDESFDGLGPTEKETCLEILSRYASDRLIIVVDHASETQGLFTQRITVRSQGGVSTLRA